MISVQAPELKGHHDDLSDAFARAVYLATDFMTSGGMVANKIVQSTSESSGSYRQYYLKQKKTASYTMRPTAAYQAELARKSAGSMLDRHSLSRLGTPGRFR
jgi:hypothetical protein